MSNAFELPIRIEPGEFNKHYLETKRAKLGHLLDPAEDDNG